MKTHYGLISLLKYQSIALFPIERSSLWPDNGAARPHNSTQSARILKNLSSTVSNWFSVQRADVLVRRDGVQRLVEAPFLSQEQGHPAYRVYARLRCVTTSVLGADSNFGAFPPALNRSTSLAAKLARGKKNKKTRKIVSGDLEAVAARDTISLGMAVPALRRLLHSAVRLPGHLQGRYHAQG